MVSRPEEPLRRAPEDDRTCPRCASHYRGEEMVRNLRVCPACDHHFPIGARERLDRLSGPEGWIELWPELRASDPLQFNDLSPYPVRVRRSEADTGVGEAIVAAELTVDGHACVGAIMVFAFMGGSMGAVVGEKLARACDRGVERGLPLLVVTASGGARMQEGILSLMQMAKTVAARERLRDAGVPFISIMLHPTTGGVAASFSFLGDVNLAEPKALIGFAGPRVIETTIRQKLPEGFQRSEFLLEHGMIDRITSRLEMRKEISLLVSHLQRDAREPRVASA